MIILPEMNVVHRRCFARLCAFAEFGAFAEVAVPWLNYRSINILLLIIIDAHPRSTATHGLHTSCAASHSLHHCAYCTLLFPLHASSKLHILWILLRSLEQLLIVATWFAWWNFGHATHIGHTCCWCHLLLSLGLLYLLGPLRRVWGSHISGDCRLLDLRLSYTCSILIKQLVVPFTLLWWMVLLVIPNQLLIKFVEVRHVIYVVILLDPILVQVSGRILGRLTVSSGVDRGKIVPELMGHTSDVLLTFLTA